MITKVPKKAKKGIVHLHDLIEQLRFFYQDSGRFKNEVLTKAIYIEDVLYELSLDKKINHVKFINKFKHLMGKENEELKTEVNELKEKLKERGEKIQELIGEKK